MRSYFLIDGMMIYDVMRAQKLMHAPEARWCAPLIEGKAHRLVGPMLIDSALAKAAGEAVSVTVGKLIIAFPAHLHLSIIHSEVDLPTLTTHLRRFAAFYDDDAQLLALRLADCRRLIDLPHLMTTEQWGDLTSLMAQWHFHDRQGQELALSLPPDREKYQSDRPFRLSPSQLQALSYLSEPDSLLNDLGYTPHTMGADMAAYWKLASQCVSIWRQSGSDQRDVLVAFGEKILATKGQALRGHDWPSLLAHAELQKIADIPV